MYNIILKQDASFFVSQTLIVRETRVEYEEWL
jgi:hypothetical protein